MSSRNYLYLIALAREKHGVRAALVCHISPSTLSVTAKPTQLKPPTSPLSCDATLALASLYYLSKEIR